MKRLITLSLSACLCTFSSFSQGKVEVFSYVEQMPDAGYDVNEYIAQHINLLPEDAKQIGASGKAVLRFIVNEHGGIDSIKIIRSVIPRVDSEIVRVAKEMPRWKPGLNGGKPVNVYFTQPVMFKLAQVTNEIFDMEPHPSQALFKYLAENARYPDELLQTDLSGNVTIEFSIGTDSSINNIKVKRSADTLLSKEAIRVIKSIQKWKPYQEKGQAIKKQYELNVFFQSPNAEIFTYTETMPEFRSDLSTYLSRAIEYPPRARDKGIMGRVVVKFVINEDGTTSDPVLVTSIHPDLDNEALRVVRSMPTWKPGKIKGKPVKVYYTLPIKFTIQ